MEFHWTESRTKEWVLSIKRGLRKLCFGTVTLVGGQLFVYGGENGSGQAVGNLFTYTIATETWAERVNTSLPRLSEHGTVLVDDALLIVGGKGSFDKHFVRYDLLLNWCTWLLTYGDGPGCLRGHSSAFFPRLNAVLVFAGSNSPAIYHRLYTWTNDVYALSLSSHKWSKLAPKGQPPSPRERASAVTVGNKWFIWGGSAGPQGYSDLFVLDVTSYRTSWSEVNRQVPGVFPRYGCLVHVHGTLIIVGEKSWALDLKERTWCKIDGGDPSSNYAMHGIPPCLRRGNYNVRVNNSVIVFGGEGEIMFEPNILSWVATE